MIHRYICKIRRGILYVSLLAGQLFNQFNQFINSDHLVAAKIEYLISQGFQSRDRAACNVIDIRETARLFSIPIDTDRLSLNDPFHESENGEIRSTCGSIDCEVADDGHIDII